MSEIRRLTDLNNLRSGERGLPVPALDEELPGQIADEDDEISPENCAAGGISEVLDEPPVSSIDDDGLEKSVPLSALAWEAYELSYDWNKSLKGDHGILAALDLSLPLPMCNVDISSPTKPRDILDIFGDVMDLPPLNNFMDTRMDTGDDREVFGDRCDSPVDASGMQCDVTPAASNLHDVSIGGASTVTQLDRSNTLMTPQELERMPDQGLEFEQSVGPKELPKTLSTPGQFKSTSTEKQQQDAGMMPPPPEPMAVTEHPVVLSQTGEELTSITVLTSMGEKSFKVNTDQLRKAASLMQPVIITDDNDENFTLVMLPVAKMNLLQPAKGSFAKFKCLHCEKTFERSYKLRIHEMMKHSLEKPYKCSYDGCKWAFSDAYRLRYHEKTHLKIKDHKCSHCEKSYTSIWNLRTHVSVAHESDKLFKCQYCDAHFTAETKMYKHFGEVHPEKPKQFLCDEEGCNAEFYSKLGLMRHLVGHKKRKELNLVCPYETCGKTFAWKSRFDNHMRQHKAEKPFKCTFQGCKSAFNNHSMLNRHMKIHTDKKAHMCTICSKTFHRLDHLNNHLSSHSDEKSFRCTYPGCPHASASKSALDAHLKRHAIKDCRALLICPDQHCDCTFPTKTRLIRHINAYHPKIVEVQYTKELEDGSLDAQAEEEAEERRETLLAASAVANTNDINLDWNFDMLNQEQSNESSTVINTEVGGKQVKLILPQHVLTDAVPLSSIQAPTITKQRLPVKGKMGKGCARTDLLVNENLCARSKARQQRLKEETAMQILTQENLSQSATLSAHMTAGVDTGAAPLSHGCLMPDFVSQSTITSNVLTLSMPSKSLSSPTKVVPTSSTISSTPSGLENWLSVVGQDGVESDRVLLSSSDIIYSNATTSEVLEQLSGTMDETSDFPQLYNDLP